MPRMPDTSLILPLARGVTWPALCAVVLALSACGGGTGGGDPGTTKLSAAATLGKELFRDTSLSASGRMSCATCHVPATGHSTNDPDRMVPAGGDALAT